MKKFVKIFLIFLIGAIIVIAAYSAWIYLIKPTVTPTKGPSEITGGTDAETGIARLKTLSSQPVFDYWVKDNEVYFVAADGKIYKISSSGKEELIVNQTIQNLSRVKPSTDGSKAIISFGYPFRETFVVFNTNSKDWQNLPAGTTAAAWNPQNSNQLAILKNGGSTSLTTSSLMLYNLSDQKSQTILNITHKDSILDWVSPDEIYLTERPSAKTSGSIWKINVKNKTINPLIKETKGLIVKWFNNGENGLKFTSNNRGGNLTVIDKSNNTLTKLPTETLPSKCAVGEDYVYCAASPDFSDTILPDDYFKRKKLSADILYQIPKGLETISIALYDSGIKDIPIDAWHLELKNNRLIFINRYDQKLYSLEL